MKKTDSLSKKIFTLLITSLNRRCETSTRRFKIVKKLNDITTDVQKESQIQSSQKVLTKKRKEKKNP